MNKDTFWRLVGRIEGDPIFHNNSTHPQAPVPYQLLMTLKRLGMSGNGVSNGQLAVQFSIAGTSRTNRQERLAAKPSFLHRGHRSSVDPSVYTSNQPDSGGRHQLA
jgi:hypothetical protein